MACDGSGAAFSRTRAAREASHANGERRLIMCRQSAGDQRGCCERFIAGALRQRWFRSFRGGDFRRVWCKSSSHLLPMLSCGCGSRVRALEATKASEKSAR